MPFAGLRCGAALFQCSKPARCLHCCWCYRWHRSQHRRSCRAGTRTGTARQPRLATQALQHSAGNTSMRHMACLQKEHCRSIFRKAVADVVMRRMRAFMALPLLCAQGGASEHHQGDWPRGGQRGQGGSHGEVQDAGKMHCMHTHQGMKVCNLLSHLNAGSAAG